MVLIHEAFTANNLVGYYTAANNNAVQELGEKLFPAKKQSGLTLSFVRGAKGKPIVLKPSAFDAKTVLRDRLTFELNKQQMPFFREGLLVTEEDRQRLNELEGSDKKALIDEVINNIYNDHMHLLVGAKARLEAMRMQVLATGLLQINANGVAMDYDYNVDPKNKGAVATAWSDKATATPLEDITKAVAALEEVGGAADVLVMNSKTFAELKNADSTINAINPITKTAVTNKQLTAFLEDEYQIKIEVVKDTYINDEGEVVKYFPDGRVTLIPNSVLGNTVFGTTPEESDLVAGNDVDVSVVNTGMAVTSIKQANPVNTLNQVSMIALPSFEGIDRVYMLSTVPEE